MIDWKGGSPIRCFSIMMPTSILIDYTSLRLVSCPPELYLENKPSFICIGTPPNFYLTADCNILYTNQPDLSIATLLNRLSDLFHYYHQWVADMQIINNQKLPLKSLGDVSHKIFKKPISLFESDFKTVFIIVDPNEYQLPATFDIAPHEVYLNIHDITQLNADPEFNNAVNEMEPAIYSDRIYGYQTLFYNIYFNSVYVARLCIDAIGSSFTDRDFPLIKVMADAIKIGMTQKDITNLSQSRELHNVLKKLLDHKLVSEDRIKMTLRENSWSVNDCYFCICVKPTDHEKHNNLLSALGYHLSRLNSNSAYIIYDGHLVFLFNISYSAITRVDILNLFSEQLEKAGAKAGVSADFYDFKNFYYYYSQAQNALLLGELFDDTLNCYYFEDYLIPYLIKKCSDHTIPEMLCPSGLKNLINYDRTRQTDYCELLKIYLENNMNIAATIRQTILHRSTFLYRIEKINTILKMDLNDPDVRLSLLMAFKILKM